VKLSAPPPPPPEPNEPGQPTPEQTPGQVAEGTETPAAPTDAAPVAAKKVLVWPAWFSGADFLLSVLVLVLAFLMASFVARNSDIWLHLASGKRLLAGEYSPGTDPFSYATAGRPWVNHSLLFDIAAFLLYSGNGALLVALKAVVVVVAFGLLIAIRRSGYSLWPWAAVAGIAVIAAAPRLTLTPLVGSVLFLAVTLFLLFRMKHKPGSWRFPVAIGVTFWLWANTDEWFFLGPLVIALVLVGEVLQKQFGKRDETTENEEPLGKLPDVSTLVKALGIGVLACMLSPNHVRVWELPFELTGMPGASLDIRLKLGVLTKPLNEEYYSDKPIGHSLGHNINGLAYALLFVGGGAAIGFAGSHFRFAYLTLWVGFAALSLTTIYMIPFFAVVAVPLIAGQLNALSSRFTLKTWADQKSKYLLLSSGSGRVFVILLALIACVLAWPGWMQPSPGNEAFTRRVAWGVEADAGLKQGAEELQALRASGKLPAEAHGLITSLELANYCAWFAPLEKVYCNTRYNYQRPELSTLITCRVGLGLVPVSADDIPKTKDVLAAVEKLGIEYVVVHSGPSDSGTLRTLSRQASERMWIDSDHCSPWYLDGRSAIAGWRNAPGTEKPTFAALRINPLVLAFGPAVQRLPPGSAPPIRSQAGWEESFLRSPRVAPPGADEVAGWQSYRNVEFEKLRRQHIAVVRTFELADRLMGSDSKGVVAMWGHRMPPQGDDSLHAMPLLALWAARRAIAADGDHPDGYYALYVALSDQGLRMSDADRLVGQITALRQCLSRLPPPDRYRPGAYAANPTTVALSLAILYLGKRQEFRNVPFGIRLDSWPWGILTDVAGGYLPAAFVIVPTDGGRGVDRRWIGKLNAGQLSTTLLPLDLARGLLQQAKEYVAKDLEGREEELKSAQKDIDNLLREVEMNLAGANTRYEQARSRAGSKLVAQVDAALENNLVGEALRILKEAEPKDFGPNMPKILLSRIALDMAVGNLEEAAANLDALTTDEGMQRSFADDGFRFHTQWLTYQRLLLEGNYSEAGTIMEGIQGPFLRVDPSKVQREQFLPKGLVDGKQPLAALWPDTPLCNTLRAQLANQEAVRLVMVRDFSPLTTLCSQTPAEFVARAGVPEVLLRGASETMLGFLSLREQLQRYRAQVSDFYFRRALLSLYDANIADAKTRFLQTRQTADPEWGLLEYRPGEAENYLRLIEQAESQAAKK
jgi:hypothetical protein